MVRAMGARGRGQRANGLGNMESGSTFAGQLWRGAGVPSASRAVEDGAQSAFIRARLIVGALGLGILPPYLAWRGTSSAVDALLAVGLVAPLAAAYLAARSARLGPAYGVAAAGVAALVLCLLAGGGALSGEPAVAPAFVAAFFLLAGAIAEGGVRALQRPRMSPAEPETRLDDAALRESLGDLVTLHDASGDVIDASGAALALAGRPASALAGNGLFAQVHIPDRPAYLKALSDAGKKAGPVAVEFRLAVLPESGPMRLVWVEMRAHAAPPSGTRAAVVAVTRDASANRRHAEDIEAARLEAVQASEMKGRFLATVSHELRTPLNAIIGFSELLSADHPYVVGEERRKEYATIIRNSGHHLLEVVNTLLDMSKIESGNFAVSPEPFSLVELAHGCCDLMALKAKEAEVGVDRRIDADLPEVVADRRACRQILINLLSNAVKFTPAGGSVAITIARDGDRVVLIVADDGIGIREADLPRLGDPFFQAGDLHRRPHEGTGLGLSVVRGLVGLHHGTMAIESGPGEGTAVTITLPLAGQVESRQSRPVAVQTSARSAVRPFARKSA